MIIPNIYSINCGKNNKTKAFRWEEKIDNIEQLTKIEPLIDNLINSINNNQFKEYLNKIKDDYLSKKITAKAINELENVDSEDKISSFKEDEKNKK